MKHSESLGELSDGQALFVDLSALIESRLLIQANSGGGKSWAIRRLLEITHGQVQQIVIDVEGEFHTLREKFDYILARQHDGDCLASPRTAKLLARRLLELGVSSIVDIYELKAHERMAFVRLFLEEIVNAPKKLWHPCLIVVDEAHIFAPEKGKSESTAAVIDLMTRGRKRGFCGVLATQRLSKLHKDAAAEANNKLIGRTGLDIDMRRAADELGFMRQEDRLNLRHLMPGHFFTFGPALSLSVEAVRIGPVETTHPRPGQRSAPIPAPREKIKAILSRLADLPKEAEEEAHTIQDLKHEIAGLKRETARLQKNSGAADPKVTEQALARGREEGQRALQKAYGDIAKKFERDRLHLQGVLEKIEGLAGAGVNYAKENVDISPHTIERKALQLGTTRDVGSVERGNEAKVPVIGGGAIRMLRVLAQRYPAKFTRAQWGTLAGLAHRGGTFSTYLSRLRVAGLIEEQAGLFACTEEGLNAVGEISKAPAMSSEILAMWEKAVGPGAAGKLLRCVAEANGEAMSREELAMRCGITASGGTFGTYLSRLRSNGLIEENGDLVKVAPILLGKVQ